MRAVLAVAVATVSLASTAHAQSGFSAKVATAGIDTARGVHSDAEGNVYTVGYTSTTGSPSAPWITKHDKAGVLLWKTPFLPGTADSGHAIGFIDQFGPVVATGVRVVHFNMATGAEAWKRAIPAVGLTTATAVTGGESAWYAYVAGNTKGQVGEARLGGDDAWIAKYDGGGNLIWTRQIGTVEHDFATSVSFDATGNFLYVGGYTRGLDTVYTDNWRFPVRTWVMKYDSNGNLLWKQILDGPGDEVITAVAAHYKGVFVTGWTDSAVAATNQGRKDLWAAFYRGDGVRTWVQQWGTWWDDTPSDAVVQGDNVIIGGTTFGNLFATLFGSSNAWMLKLSYGGVKLWSRQWGSGGGDSAAGMGVDASGNIAIAGASNGTTGTDAWISGFPQAPVNLVVAEAQRTVVRPASGTRTAKFSVLLDRSGFSGLVSLAVRGLPTGATASFFLSKTKAASSTLTVVVPSTAPIANSQLYIDAVAAGITIPSATTWLNVVSDGAVTLYPSPATASVNRGGSASFAVSLGRTNFPDPVALEVTGLPAGASARWSSNPGTGASSTLTIDTSSAMMPGTFTLTVNGIAAGVTIASKTVSLTVAVVPTVVLSGAPASLNLTAGQSSTVVINLARTAYTGAVTMSTSSTMSGLGVNIQPQGAAGNTATLYVTTTAATAGTGSITVGGAATGVGIERIYIPVTVVQPSNVRLSVSPTTRTITAGQSTTVTVNLARTSFTGSVNLAVTSGLIPSALTASFNPATAAGASSTLTITTTATAAGAHVLTIGGTATGATVVPVSLPLVVVAPSGVTLTATPSPVIINPTQIATYAITINRSNFTGAVALAASGAPSGSTVVLNPTSATAGAATLTVTPGALTSPGTYNINISGTATGVTIAPIMVQLTITAMRVLAEAHKRCHNGNADFTIDYLNSGLAPPNPGNVTSTRHRFVLTAPTMVTLRWTPQYYNCSSSPWNMTGRYWHIKQTGAGDIGTGVVQSNPAVDQTMALAAGNWEINVTETTAVPGDFYVLAP